MEMMRARGLESEGHVAPVAQPEHDPSLSIAGYTNNDNPFHDPQLTKKFVWKSKERAAARKRSTGAPPASDPFHTSHSSSHASRPAAPQPRNEHRGHDDDDLERRAQQVQEELEAIKRRRAEREAELAAMEDEKLARLVEQEAEAHGGFAAQEEKFSRETVLQRSSIRIREGRTRAIDMMALLLDLHAADKVFERAAATEASVSKAAKAAAAELALTTGDDDAESDAAVQEAKDTLRAKLATLPLCIYHIPDPVAYLQGLSLTRLEGLVADARANRDADPERELWHLIIQLGAHMISIFERHIFASLADSDTAMAPPSAGAPHPPSRDPLTLSLADCEAVHASVSADVAALLAGKSHAELLELEAQVRAQLDDPAAAAVIDTEFFSSVLDALEVSKAHASLRSMHAAALVRQGKHLAALLGTVPPRGTPPTHADIDGMRQAAFLAHVGIDTVGDSPLTIALIRHTNHILHPMSAHPFALAVQAVDDAESVASALGAELEDELDGMREEMINDARAVLGERSAMWDDKTKPRKPLYFARVISGYRWTSWARAHFDKDNPPPRQVQGLKLAVLLPDLLDKTATPTFKVIPNGDETATLLISPGPPYLDLAFSTLDKSWDRRPRAGYRCTFERGVFKLNFRYKRQIYRK
ncbi:uncharacterized protein AMSG_04462 [Thecamonas trahens ATCC 50062]|uniref:Splicing factor Cactin n=1 Tax=Thecamonas trahens ATCC 50062 TaxID=461836 RepID=A0A0L0D843_THETB|nr:hypothetical protein AMSG_04462 [Thecamonas trahens ATCC 50062]KNC48231.1 hypothetical protein AMSG_04462 [Thecamonas trahens ATCC 50062]|eukprot:XP_013758800.1 hypothetical protein AMSG_04462 [Thecamonas trahens ATCC 50062]